ncbi:unnamed protein product [Caretta caretta]
MEWRAMGELGWLLLTAVWAQDEELLRLQRALEGKTQECMAQAEACAVAQEVVTSQAERAQELTRRCEVLVARVVTSDRRPGGEAGLDDIPVMKSIKATILRLAPDELKPSLLAAVLAKNGGGVQHVLALIDTGTEVTILHSAQAQGRAAVVKGLGGAETPAYEVTVTLTLGKAPPFWATVLAAAIGEYILGIYVLQGRSVDTQYCLFVFGDPWYVSATRVREVRALMILLGSPRWEPIVLPSPTAVVSKKQYHLPGGEEEITQTISALLEAKVIRPTLSPYNSSLCPVRKPDGTWRMTVDYRELNKGWKHSPTICHQLVSADLARIQLPDTTRCYHYIDDVMVSGPSRELVVDALHAVITGLEVRGWTLNPHKIQGPTQMVVFLGIMWAGPEQQIPQKVRQTVQGYPPLQSKKGLQAFLGLLRFWRAFVPHLAFLMQPLQALVWKAAPWQWTRSHQTAFDLCKKLCLPTHGSTLHSQGSPSSSKSPR